MENSLKASELGLQRIDLARRRKGWNKTSPVWCSIAFTSKATLNRFWAKKAIRSETFIAICQAVKVNWENVAEREEYEFDSLNPKSDKQRHQDWGDAPDPKFLYGRLEELDILKQWVNRDRCRLITVLGMGGIGKTTLVAKLAQHLKSDFEFLIWRSLRNAPFVTDIITELVQFLSNQEEVNLPDSLDGKMLRLLYYLRNSRCLLILDNVESILQGEARVGKYQPRHQEFGQLFKIIGETSHQSCLVLTSRELPQEISVLEGKKAPVRCFQLGGLSVEEGREIFQEQGNFVALEDRWQTAIAGYGGNPLALKIAASAVRDLFDGNLNSFVQFVSREGYGSFVFEDIGDLLQQQWSRLTFDEETIMYWLAINREPVSLIELQEDFAGVLSSKEILTGLVALQKRSLIEKISSRFTQQPVIMEYVIENLIDRTCEEIVNQKLFLLGNHALVKAQAPEYVQDIQISLILQPLINRLLNHFGSVRAIVDCLNEILHKLQKSTSNLEDLDLFSFAKYTCGNIINLLCQLQIDLSNYNFANLPVWQANLREIKLHQVNFTGCDLSRSVFTETLGNISSATFSPDGKLIATCDFDCLVRLWQVKTGKLLNIFEGHANWVRAIAFSPDGRILASRGADRTVKIWNVVDGSCCKTFTGHSNEIFSLAFSPNIQILASSSGDGTIKIWNFLNGQCVQTLDEHQGWVRSVAFNPDGRILASGSDDGTIKIWNFLNGQCSKTYQEHTDGVYAVAFCSSRILACGGGDGIVRLWNINHHQCIKTLQGNQNQIFSVAFNVDNQTLVCASLDKTVRQWDIHGGKCLKTWSGHTNWSLPVAFGNDGKTIVSGDNDRSVRLWDVETGRCLQSFLGRSVRAFAAEFCCHNQYVVSGTIDRTIELWNVDDGVLLKTLHGHSDWVYSVAFNHDATVLASGSADQTIKLWDVGQGECLQTFAGHNKQVYSVAFGSREHSIGGQLCNILISGSMDRTIKLWNINSGCCLKTLTGHTGRVFTVAFNPQVKIIASGSADQTIKLWDIDNGHCLKTLIGHTNWIFSIAFSPNGQTLASASQDRTVRLWDVATGNCLQVFRGHKRLVSSVAFSPDGQTLVSGSQDRVVRLWDIKTGECIRTFVAERIYEGMNIKKATGLTQAQKVTLKMLGAIEK